MRNESATTSTPRSRRRRASAVLAVISAVVILTSACADDDPKVRNASDASTDGPNVNTGRAPQGSGTPPADGGQGRTAGEFTTEFARCMREHGVPNFPDPNGTAGQLGPNSGIDPTSAAFQSALNGPCKPLAPTAWLSSDSGPGSVAGNGG